LTVTAQAFKERIKLKLFIFDMGGVVVRNCNVVPHIAQVYGTTEEELRNSEFMSMTDRLMSGEITETEFWSWFNNKKNTSFKGLLWGETFSPSIITQTVEIINRLKKKYRVVCGTNTMQPHYDLHMKNNDYGCFDKVYASHLMHAIKPDRDFYTHILSHEGVSPSDTVFIDDMFVNVLGARTIGVHGILFQTPQKLETDITTLIGSF